ncbi:MFS transporter [Streptomyces solicathayae]|uniref:MFS transporter n=1 Tax=Streptomyces solicathayae TaxID=3081768 RepID=A0ABZ0LMS8_9ACTN|nr:MFS transporter [Streptomyces sp. HUAS YS2]WOX20173.1 MFS transporter [Streptomyces sp. HUAS YS2]
MTVSPAHSSAAQVPAPGTGSGVPAGGVRRIAATLYGYSFFEEFVLFYPVYALLFSDTGLGLWQISSLFALWSVTNILLEVPSGVWADTVSRKRLLQIGPLLTAAGFALWVLFPSYWAFALGFVLWGAGGAFGSGALEALVYEELDRRGAADRYPRIMGRARAAGLVAVMVATALAGPVFTAGGYPVVGAASVLTCLVTAALASAFPEHRGKAAAAEDGEPGEAGWAATLRAGVAEARHDRSVRAAVLLVPAVTGIWGALDEYTPLLVRDTGVAPGTEPRLLLLIWAGATAGGLLAGPAGRLGARGLGALLAVAGLALAAGAAWGTPVGIVLVAIAFGGFQLGSVLADARLQDSITGPGRATVTSLAGLGTELTTVSVFGLYAVAGTAAGHGTAFALLALPYLVAAAVLSRGRRRRQ